MKNRLFSPSIQQLCASRTMLLQKKLFLIAAVLLLGLVFSKLCSANPYGASSGGVSNYSKRPSKPSVSTSYGAKSKESASSYGQASANKVAVTTSSSPYGGTPVAGPYAAVSVAKVPTSSPSSYGVAQGKTSSGQAPAPSASSQAGSYSSAYTAGKSYQDSQQKSNRSVEGGFVTPGLVTQQSQRQDQSRRERSGERFSLGTTGTFIAQENFDSPEYAKLMKESEHAIRRLESDLESKERRLENLAQKKLENLKDKVEQEIVSMRKNAEKVAFDLRSDLKQEALRLRHEAAHRTLGIISKAEEEALALRRAKRTKAFEDKFGRMRGVNRGRYERHEPSRRSHRFSLASASPRRENPTDMGTGERVSPEWKNDISRQFYSDMAYMKKIILHGESPAEVHDFNKRFAEQNNWFDKMMRSVRYIEDKAYVQVVKKQRRLQDIIAAQKQADNYLKKVSKGMTLSGRQRKKVRLMVLYDINSLSQKDGGAKLSQTDVQGVVKKTIEEFSVKFKERSGRFPDVKILDNKTTQVIPIMAQRLQEELEEAQAKIEEVEGKVKKERKKRKMLRAVAKKKIQEKASKQLEVELKLRKTRHAAAQAMREKDQAVVLAKKNQEAKMALAKRLEQSDKESMEFELGMQRAKQEVELAKEEAVKEAKDEFLQQLEEKEKKNLELDSLLRRVTERADFFKEKAAQFVGDRKLLQEKVALADKAAAEARNFAKIEMARSKEAVAKAKASEQLADNTIKSINQYLSKQKVTLGKVKKDLVVKEKKLVEAQKELQNDREIVKKERDELLAHKKLLHKEQDLLEELKKETRRLVESSMRMSDENMSEIMKIRQSAELEIRQMQDEMRKEIHFVRQELQRIKDEKDAQQSKLNKVTSELKSALHERNLMSVEQQLQKHRQSEHADNVSHVMPSRKKPIALNQSISSTQHKMTQMPVELEQDMDIPQEQEDDIDFDNNDPGMPGVALQTAKMPGI